MTLLETSWWLVFWTALGLCVGSFLNVVIYRIPHGLSIGAPVWSFCPHCQARIRWYDNLPLISYLRLGAKARCCEQPISARYPLVEVATALIVVTLFDAFFIGRVRGGLDTVATGLSWQLAEDWPIFLAHVVLFASLLALAAIDIEHYWIDTAFSTTAVIAGFVLHTVWTPRHSLPGSRDGGWIRPWDVTAVVCVAALVGLVGVSVWLRRRYAAVHDTESEPWDEAVQDAAPGTAGQSPPVPLGGSNAGSTSADGAANQSAPLESDRTTTEGASQSQAADREATAPTSGTTGGGSTRRLAAWGLGIGLVAFVLVIGHANLNEPPLLPASIRNAIPLGGLFLLILGMGAIPRPSDQEIVDAIESERLDARRIALQEFGCLVPAIVLGLAAGWAFKNVTTFQETAARILHWEPVARWDWQPAYGFATAASGYVVAAALGWSVRIGATLAFGREAFGDGDIHIMAAAGCVAGWPVAGLGFVLTCLAALAGWVLLLPFKRARAIPLVPWLALAYFATVLYYEALLAFPPVANAVQACEILLGVGKL